MVSIFSLQTLTLYGAFRVVRNSSPVDVRRMIENCPRRNSVLVFELVSTDIEAVYRFRRTI